MTAIIMGTILGGSLIAVIVAYAIMITLLAIKARKGEMASNSKGTKNLKYQEYNPIYNKYIMK